MSTTWDFKRFMKQIKSINIHKGKCIVYGWISARDRKNDRDPLLKIRMIKCVNNELIDDNCSQKDIITLFPELTEFVKLNNVSIHGLRVHYFFSNAWFYYNTQDPIHYKIEKLADYCFLSKEESELIFNLDEMNETEFTNYLKLNVVPKIKAKVQNIIEEFGLKEAEHNCEGK